MSEEPEEPAAPEVVIVSDTGASSARFLASIAPKSGPARMLDPVSVSPHLVGVGGRGWRVNLPAMRLKQGLDGSKDGTIAVWIIEAPWAHPIWHTYAMVLVHLRPIPGGPKVARYLEGATHEFWLFALDPGEPGRITSRQSLLADGLFGIDGAPGFLTPMQFGAQFIADTDEAAASRLEPSVKAIIDGILSPDTDAFGEWKYIWGEAMIRPEFR